MSATLALSETALTLINHAATDIPTAVAGYQRPGRVLSSASGHSTDPRDWLRETALLRLISIIEAYVDAVSMQRMGLVVDQRQTLVALLLGDFELASSSSWQDRHDAFARYHGFTLRSRDGWGDISAGIEVRNCLLHGMGALTAKQRSQTKLATAVRTLDVSIGSNRMYLSAATVSKLAGGCKQFVLHVDSSIAKHAP